MINETIKNIINFIKSQKSGEVEDKFEIAFLEAPALIANEVMEGWVKELKEHL